MGQLVRLNTVFGNKKLPVIIDRDISALEAEIRALPGLRAFWDMSDPAVRNVSVGRIVKITDKSALGNHLTATPEQAPLLDNSILGGVSSAYFDGSKGMVSDADAFKASMNNMTIVVFAMKSEATTPASSILIAGQTNAYVTVYTSNAHIAINSANLNLAKGNLIGKPLSLIASTDFSANRSTIRDDKGFNSGANLTPRKLKDEPALVGKWPASANPDNASGWKGYVGHVMVFDGYIADNQYTSNLLLEYARRKYNTPAWE